MVQKHTHTRVYAQKHTLIQSTLTASATPSAVWVRNVSYSKEKNHCVTFGKKKKKNHSKCFFGRKNNKLFLSLTCRSLTELTTLSQLIEHGGPEELLEKCEFNGVVVRQTHAINTLHFALTPNTHTHTHTHTHTQTQTRTRLLCEEGLRVELCACMFVCVNIDVCVRVCLCVCACVRAVSLSSPMHPVPACPAFRQLPDQPWGFQCNLLCIPTTCNGCTGISFRANCPNHSSADAAIRDTRTVSESVVFWWITCVTDKNSVRS